MSDLVKIINHLPLPLGPITEAKSVKGPILCEPLNDLKFFNSIEIS